MDWCHRSWGIPVLLFRSLPSIQPEEQEDDSHLPAASQNASGKINKYKSKNNMTQNRSESDFAAASSGSHANSSAAEEVRPNAVCWRDQSREVSRWVFRQEVTSGQLLLSQMFVFGFQWGESAAAQRSPDQTRDLLHPLRHLPHSGEAQDHHLQEPFQESVSQTSQLCPLLNVKS